MAMLDFLKDLLGEGGSVAYVILFVGALTFLIFCERLLYLHRCKVDTKEMLHGLMNQLRNGNVKEAIVNCDSTNSPVGEIVRAAIERWGAGENAIRQALDETATVLIPVLEARMKLLSFLGNLAPVLGLLGTLLSMMQIFERMKLKGGHFIETMELAGDIRSALVCTVLGLMVAVAAQLFYLLLSEKIDWLIVEMRKAASEITFFLSSNRPAGLPDEFLPGEVELERK
ncbi:MAG: MotA/TolQ/ExbB proton channel family protein [Victivallales bacterium]|nr:MotA/TolQ/ExbB proton channel family protein [Victivallales bacterium]